MRKIFFILLIIASGSFISAFELSSITGYLNESSPEINIGYTLNQQTEIRAKLSAINFLDGPKSYSFGLSTRFYKKVRKTEPFFGVSGAIYHISDTMVEDQGFSAGLLGGAQYAVMENLYVGFRFNLDFYLAGGNFSFFGAPPGNNLIKTSLSPLYISLYW